jgi:hypothetical protein
MSKGTFYSYTDSGDCWIMMTVVIGVGGVDRRPARFARLLGDLCDIYQLLWHVILILVLDLSSSRRKALGSGHAYEPSEWRTEMACPNSVKHDWQGPIFS